MKNIDNEWLRIVLENERRIKVEHIFKILIDILYIIVAIILILNILF